MTKLAVIFRKDKYTRASGSVYEEIVAVFPTEQGVTSDASSMEYYTHVGQHSSCSLAWYYTTKPAQPEEYAKLLKEVQGFYGGKYEGDPDGIELVVYKRRQRSYSL